jgi:hypothetical protein
MKFILRQRAYGTTRKEYIADVKRTARKLRKKTLTKDDYSLNGKYHAESFRKQFGSWFHVLKLAGLQPSRPPMFIPEEDLFANIAVLWKRLRRQPVFDEMEIPFSKYCGQTYKNRFGTWRKALDKFARYVNSPKGAHLRMQIERGPVLRNPHRRQMGPYRMMHKAMERDHFSCRNCGRSPARNNVTLSVVADKPWQNSSKLVMDDVRTLCSLCIKKRMKSPVPFRIIPE